MKTMGRDELCGVTRSERTAVFAFGLVIGGFAAVLATGVADQLGRRSWFGNGANIIQWVSAPATFVAVVAGFASYGNRTCAASWRCFRWGEHPVDGCLKKVCTHHHTLEHHDAVHYKHAQAHALSGRLDRSESHGRKT